MLPFLLGDALVARVDLKSDRQRSVLLVQGAFGKRGSTRSHVAQELAAELRLAADWLGLDRVLVRPRGDLSRALAGSARGANALSSRPGMPDARSRPGVLRSAAPAR